MLGNILVLGNSGVGKSTLINAVLGEEIAYTSYGTSGTTKELKIYGNESDTIPFRLIDSVGFEPDPKKARQAISLVSNWTKDAKKDGSDTQIDLVWFCVDGCAAKLFLSSIECLAQCIKPWKDVPIIAVITKSYSESDQNQNIEMVYNAFARQTFHACNLHGVFPVVAKTFSLNDTVFVPPTGISALVDKSIELLPEGRKNAAQVVSDFRLNRKRIFAQSTIAGAVTSAVTVCALPLPVVDALPLTAIETAELNALAKIYEIGTDTPFGNLTRYILECGAVTGAARTVLSALKGIPALGIVASVLNSIVAGVIVAVLGETVSIAYEQIYTGKHPIDTEWLTKLLAEKLDSNQLIKSIQSVAEKIGTSTNPKEIISTLITSLVHK